MRTRPSQNPPVGSADVDESAFVAALAALSANAAKVAALGGQKILRGLAELDPNSGELQEKVMLLMDEIEASFRRIRRKLRPL